MELPVSRDVIKLYFIETWGCQMNVHDSEKLAGSLQRMGFRPAGEESEADLIIFNTCSVREKVEEKVFARLGKLKKLTRAHEWDRGRIIGIAGCVAQQEGKAIIDRAPYVDFVLGTQSLFLLPEILERVLRRKEKFVETGSHPENLDIPPERIERILNVKAFITVMEGCDNFCSFCVVPFTRGRERCRPVASIVREARSLAEEGFKEIQLLGQNVNSYRDPKTGETFAELLDSVTQTRGIERLRFTSPHPNDFDQAILERFRDLPKLCPHIHLPAQSGSSSVLARMKRGYSREAYLAQVDRIRALVPDIAVSTDLIVGFPGETADEFEETMTLVQEVGFDSIFSFKYSPRPHTLAQRTLPNDVPDAVKGERLMCLQDVQKRIQIRKNESFVGQTVQVLVDGVSKKDREIFSGRSPHNRVVNFFASDDCMGQSIDIGITRAGPNSLFGKAMV